MFETLEWKEESIEAPAGITRTAFVCLLIFTFASSFSIALSQLALGLCVLTLFLALALSIEIRRNLHLRPRSLSLAILGYLCWQIIAALINANPVDSLLGLREEWLFLILPIVIWLIADERSVRYLITVLAIAVTLVSIYALIQYFTGQNWLRGIKLDAIGPGQYRLAGFFSHPLTFGNYLVTVSGFLAGVTVLWFGSMERRMRILMVTASILGLLVTALSGSRGPMVASLGAVVFMGIIIKKTRWLVIGFAAVMVAVVALSPGYIQSYRDKLAHDLDPDNQLSRLFIWETSASIGVNHPLLGVGQSNFKEHFTPYLRPGSPERQRQSHAHNDMLNVAAVSGIPGLILFLLIWIMIVRRFIKTYRTGDSFTRALAFGAICASVAFAVASLTEATFADEEVRQALMLCWGMGLVGVGISSNTRSESS